MATKVIYFVRHGESVLNSQGIRQGAEGALTDKGREQALATARKFPKHKGRPQVLISSPFERTKETSDIIAHELGITDIEYSDLLKERRNPREIIGHHGDESEVRQIIDLIDKGFHKDNFRYSDEENFADLKERAKALLEYISQRKEKRILMVTHNIFLKMIISYMLMGESLTASEYNKLSFLNPIENAGLTICTYKKWPFCKPEWKLLVWNDILQPEMASEVG
ncbi:MAG: hypothetical protein AB200_01070 [Parcubacteria bacterium C7867-005]|nr:MAG: hypothetical protein AB200_01070 [Parcubacteria bacterium C7867-005]